MRQQDTYRMDSEPNPRPENDDEVGASSIPVARVVLMRIPASALIEALDVALFPENKACRRQKFQVTIRFNPSVEHGTERCKP